MTLLGLRTWASQHALAFAVVVWAIPAAVLAPLAFLAEEPLAVLPIILAAPIVPAAAAYGANRSST